MEQFNSAVIAKKLDKKVAEALKPMTNTITGLESPREIIRWVFDENTKKGDVSKVFDLQKSYVVAYLKEIREKGIPTLDQIKKQIEPLAKREKKADMIIKKINAMKTAGISLKRWLQRTAPRWIPSTTSVFHRILSRAMVPNPKFSANYLP